MIRTYECVCWIYVYLQHIYWRVGPKRNDLTHFFLKVLTSFVLFLWCLIIISSHYFIYDISQLFDFLKIFIGELIAPTREAEGIMYGLIYATSGPGSIFADVEVEGGALVRSGLRSCSVCAETDGVRGITSLRCSFIALQYSSNIYEYIHVGGWL